MSQAGDISAVAGPVPPAVATSYVTDNGTAIPALNILIINGIDSTEDNANGIIVNGGVVGTGTGNEVDVVLTNRKTYTLTTNGLTPGTLLSFPLGGTDGTYLFKLEIVAWDTTLNLSSGYSISGLVMKTLSGAASIIGLPSIDTNEEGVMVGVDVTITNTANNLEVDVIGLVGSEIHWNCLLTYSFVS